MDKKLTSSDLQERVAFDRQYDAPDGYGGTTSAWVEQFQVRAGYTHLRGGETVQAARLTGTHVQVITVRASSETRGVTSDWRARDVRSGATFQIRDVSPAIDRKSLDFLCEAGAPETGVPGEAMPPPPIMEWTEGGFSTDDPFEGTAISPQLDQDEW